jgi:ubiquinone/menaquinone biosynthesis C-methylase UbiE
MTDTFRHQRAGKQETETKKENQPSWLKEGSTDSEEVADFYDTWAETYDEHLKDWDYRAPTYAAKLLKQYVSTEQAILDAGCGTGLTGKALHLAGYENISGIDISATSLSKADQLNVYSSLLAHDLQQPLPFHDNNYDALICIGVLTYIENCQSLLKEFCRIVKPGGHIAFSQRSDLFDARHFPDIIAALEQEDIWENIKISSPQAYLPKNKDFSDKVQAIFCICKVV